MSKCPACGKDLNGFWQLMSLLFISRTKCTGCNTKVIANKNKMVWFHSIMTGMWILPIFVSINVNHWWPVVLFGVFWGVVHLLFVFKVPLEVKQ